MNQVKGKNSFRKILKDAGNPVIYGAFDSNGSPCIMLRKGKKEIPLIESKDFILNSGGFKQAIDRIESWGFTISPETKKPTVIALLS